MGVALHDVTNKPRLINSDRLITPMMNMMNVPASVPATVLAMLFAAAAVQATCTVDQSSLRCYADYVTPPPGTPRVRVLGPPVYSNGMLTQEYCAQVC